MVDGGQVCSDCLNYIFESLSAGSSTLTFRYHQGGHTVPNEVVNGLRLTHKFIHPQQYGNWSLKPLNFFRTGHIAVNDPAVTKATHAAIYQGYQFGGSWDAVYFWEKAKTGDQPLKSRYRFSVDGDTKLLPGSRVLDSNGYSVRCVRDCGSGKKAGRHPHVLRKYRIMLCQNSGIRLKFLAAGSVDNKPQTLRPPAASQPQQIHSRAQRRNINFA